MRPFNSEKYALWRIRVELQVVCFFWLLFLLLLLQLLQLPFYSLPQPPIYDKSFYADTIGKPEAQSLSALRALTQDFQATDHDPPTRRLKP